MIEAYAFLAAFAAQILVISVLIPAWFIRNFRAKAALLPADRLAQVYPGVDVRRVQERFLAQYRALATGIAVLALLLLAWLFVNVSGAEWNEGKAEALAIAYFLVAFMVPLFHFGRFVARFNKEHRPAEVKRTAILQRRGLFDFVSPYVVSLAVLAYFLFAAICFYVQRDPFPGFAGPLINIGGITLVYAMNAIALYVTLYGKKNPLETHASRLHTIGLSVKGIVYSCIVIVVFSSLNFSLRLLDLKSWEPFALSIFFAICALLASAGFTSPLRKTDEDGFASNPAR